MNTIRKKKQKRKGREKSRTWPDVEHRAHILHNTRWCDPPVCERASARAEEERL